MKKVQYLARNGRQQWRPVFDREFEMLASESMQGFCLACGEEVEGVEPDARKYECESCGEAKVYGLEELLLMGLVKGSRRGTPRQTHIAQEGE